MKKTKKLVQVTSSSDLERDVLKALRHVLRYLGHDGVLGSKVSAGFRLPPKATIGKGVPRAGWQLFVEACRFDEALLTEHPETGGLVIDAPKSWRRKHGEQK